MTRLLCVRLKVSMWPNVCSVSSSLDGRRSTSRNGSLFCGSVDCYADLLRYCHGQYEHLSTYKKATDLAIYIENVVNGFSRYHKYSTGADLRNSSGEVVRPVISANSSENKLQTLLAFRDTIEELKVTIRICKEVKAFRSFSAFHYATEAVVSLKGWLKSVRGRPSTVSRVTIVMVSLLNRRTICANNEGGLIL